MALRRIGRLSVFSLLLLFGFINAYEIPTVNIQAFTPKGFRASIPDAPNVGLFVFQGNVNRQIGKKDVGALSGEVLEATDGRWVFSDPNIQLKVGDVINYYVFVSVNSAGYLKDKLTFTISELEDRGAPIQPAVQECRPSKTIIQGRTACSGQTIFEDDFLTLREDLWQVEHYVPLEHPEFPYVSYQKQTVSVENGHLRIAPVLQQNLPGFNNESIYSGELNLFEGCTATANECAVRASGASILPPIASGRITSKGLVFTYGTVHVRAKLPQGDWLYPEILLEPIRKKYGNLFASGVLKIASARGNRELTVGVNDFGNKVLYGGPIMSYSCRQYLIQSNRLSNGKMWGDDFHVYTLNWTPDRIVLLVDNEEWARIEPLGNGLQGRFPPNCRDVPRSFLAMGSKMAPFDDNFYITLGVAAGGITEFRDDYYTQGYRPKPWKNQGRKASLYFWKDMENWLSTWETPELLVDYIKVVAI
ncbi:beta-1,3-glucan-binding protein-like [Pectinophora gossypiella]|nr:beta-1,3-glucan-binding protein-like [Pectinophora gossypiella]